jgi:hypothetical protein
MVINETAIPVSRKRPNCANVRVAPANAFRSNLRVLGVRFKNPVTLLLVYAPPAVAIHERCKSVGWFSLPSQGTTGRFATGHGCHSAVLLYHRQIRSDNCRITGLVDNPARSPGIYSFDRIIGPCADISARKTLGERPMPQGIKQLSAPHAVLVGVDGGSGLAVGFAPALGFALIPVLLALGQRQFAFHPAVAEVKAGGDERVALDLRLGE